MGCLTRYKFVIGVSVAGSGVILWYIYNKYFKTPLVCCFDKCLYKDITNNNTLIAENYSPEVHIQLGDKETSNEYSLKDLVKHSVGRFKTKNARKPTGIVIGDEECYDVFQEIIDPVIKDLHAVNCFRRYESVRFKDCDWRKIKAGRIVNKNVLSIVLSTSRNIAGCRFPCSLSNEERVEIAKELVAVLNCLPAHLHGAYTRLCNLSGRRQDKLGLSQDYGLSRTIGPSPLPCVPENRPQLSHTNLNLFEKWNSPDGRVLWWTENRKCKVFINFLDHIKFVISNTNGDLRQAVREYMEILAEVEQILKRKQHKEFAWSSKYGYLTSDLTDVGTGLHIEVKIRFKMVHKTEFFNRLMVTKQLNCSQCVDEKNTDTFIITNKNLIGTTEVDIIQQVVDGITLLLETDKRLSRGEETKDIMP
ncbi:creatine kinase U-type, mitochondrial-like [Actinia tenebrosa]|uniref:Creatine kinase U-type, mitochondrial-like n=1 Tax=Actinia tenebrosa TaxID=6105 RepID=A0A6P8IES6_ACTTE|nr:creatine kinase U-type, mitochondrial-like [Actinia tenebrosa]